MDSTIRKNISTKATAEEMKLYINQNILSRKELTALFDSAVWVGNTLNVQSKLGSGTVVLQDNLVEITINLSFFGKLTKKQLESGIDIGFKQLSGKS
jgi:hypothetical protein